MATGPNLTPKASTSWLGTILGIGRPGGTATPPNTPTEIGHVAPAGFGSHIGAGAIGIEGQGQGRSTSFKIASINPHPHWFNSQIVHDGAGVPVNRTFNGLGSWQAGQRSTMPGTTGAPGPMPGPTPVMGQNARSIDSGILNGETPATGQVGR